MLVPVLEWGVRPGVELVQSSPKMIIATMILNNYLNPMMHFFVSVMGIVCLRRLKPIILQL